MNTELLEAKIKESGKKKTFLAKKIGMSQPCFRAMCQGKTQIKANHLKLLCAELGIKTFDEISQIFFN